MSNLQDNLLNIKTQKDTYIIPENIKKDVTVLGVTGTLETKENLDVVLTQQETKLQELENIVKIKTQGSAKPLIFVQETEPSSKNGIWLQTDKEVEHYIADDDIYLKETWLEKETVTLSNQSQAAVALIDNNIYIFGGRNTAKTTYKYDFNTKTYTQLSDIPYNFYIGTTAVVGTNIYLFSNTNYPNHNYKYDTLTNTYTQLSNVPKSLNSRCSCIVMGTNIYLITDYSTHTNLYKYDTLTNTYTQLSNIPYECYCGKAIGVGTDIYIFGGITHNYSYKYDTLTDTYTQLSDLPYNAYYNGIAKAGDSIYLFGSGNNNYSTKLYRYNIISDTFTVLEDMPISFNEYNDLAFDNNFAYIFSEGKYIYKFRLTDKSYNVDNTVVIKEGTDYTTQLLNTNFEKGYELKNSFNNVYYYTTQGGLDDTIPTYYGDGTQWIKFKN